MALYTNESRERVRDAVDFLELVSARTELRRAGPRSYEGLCPFHDERTPSFSVEPIQKVYYCFGCQASGDVFRFVQETEGLDFKEALEFLANRCGIELERESEDPGEAERRRKRERLLELLGRTAAYYERYLWDSKEAHAAREYLQGRGLEEQMLRQFRVGYAPSAWDRVLLASRGGGFSEQELYATGLVQRSRENDRPYDRFRARITFPLADIRGRVLGFGARAMQDEATPAEASGRRPKYLNTSDNDIYHKGLHLYGADLARAHATRAGQVILCEGYTDVIALHQAGLQNTVGLMGTALTPEQVSELARMASTVLLALDADSAGQEAMLRASTLAAQRKLELRVVLMPPGTDPAELVAKEGSEAMRKATESSVPFVSFRVQRELDRGDRSSSEGVDRIIGELRPVFATLPPSAMRMELTRLVSGHLQLPESIAQTLLAQKPGASEPTVRAASVPAGEREPAAPRAAPSVLSRREETERTFLALCIASPPQGEPLLAELTLSEYFTSDLLRRAAEHLQAGRLAEPVKGLDGADQALLELLAELVVEAGRESTHPAMLEVQRQQLELARIDRQIQTARAQGAGDVSDLAHRRTEVKRAFDRAQERALEHTAG
ncbi:MAG: DNA primase [Solirubrobacteraceae bacterium]